MKYFGITRGLDLRLAGSPDQRIDPVVKEIKHVAVTGPDYVGMKPTLLVSEGDEVKAGQAVFEDKKNPGVLFVSPGAGVVEGIHRGEKRSFRSLMIKLHEGELGNESVAFERYDESELESLEEDRVRENLVASGLWTCFRTRPFSRIPKLGSSPSSIFVTAMDTNPGAPDPQLIIEQTPEDFVNGLKILSCFGKKVWVCRAPKSDIPEYRHKRVETVVFDGPHPAGLAGTHIHYLDPVGLGKTVWTIGYQDVMAIGRLFTTGVWPTERIVALSGPKVKAPRLLRTRVGACLYELSKGELSEGPSRIISGSVLCGRAVEENGMCCLGPYVNQVSAIDDGDPREFFGWALPGWRKFSLARTVASRYLPAWPFKMNTAMHGGHRAVFPNDMFEKICPLDLLPVFLFRALEVGDIEKSEQLGALELDEEDVALCTLVDFGKNDYTTTLRAMLNTMMKEEE
ncbi:MAG: Na(+)-translocating NADH-quinone reductase subunit A [Planctomycetia bacterium]|nr:Na(+)-translocating NADH-quinone reductase subunit A [Planctomycetia bacterium]